MSEETTTQATETAPKPPSPHMGLSITVVVVFGLLALILRNPILLIFLLAAFGALYYSLKTKKMIKQGDDEKAKKYSKYAKRSAWALLIFVIIIGGFVGSMIFVGMKIVKSENEGRVREAAIKSLYERLDAYQQKYGAYPGSGTVEGVKALYPLYKEGYILRSDLEKVLQPPGGEYEKFSDDPSPKEFDANHIGWSFNAKARPGSDDPLLSYQGVKTGKYDYKCTDKGTKPLTKMDTFVVLANGTFMEASISINTGDLFLDTDIDWSLLKD
ncbi:CD225/dispanin family protein [bacterium]|nr:CD225/dispanin family protein [bacterium]